MMPNGLPPWEATYPQTQRWMGAGVFEAIVYDLRIILRLAEGRTPHPSAAILDSRTLQSTPESGPRAGYDGAKRKRGSKVHMAVETLGHLPGDTWHLGHLISQTPLRGRRRMAAHSRLIHKEQLPFLRPLCQPLRQLGPKGHLRLSLGCQVESAKIWGVCCRTSDRGSESRIPRTEGILSSRCSASGRR